MPYILKADRSLEFNGEQNVLSQAAQAIASVGDDRAKAREARNFIAFLIDGIYGETCFEHSASMANMLPQPLVICANLLGSNIVAIHERDGGREGLLNYATTRLFNEIYPSARYKDYNAIEGILTSLTKMVHPDSLELLGMLGCCAKEYYRKRSGPYEDKKEGENGAVLRPDVPEPTAY